MKFGGGFVVKDCIGPGNARGTSHFIFPGHMTDAWMMLCSSPAGHAGRLEMKVYWQNDDEGGSGRPAGWWIDSRCDSVCPHSGHMGRGEVPSVGKMPKPIRCAGLRSGRNAATATNSCSARTATVIHNPDGLKQHENYRTNPNRDVQKWHICSDFQVFSVFERTRTNPNEPKMGFRRPCAALGVGVLAARELPPFAQPN